MRPGVPSSSDRPRTRGELRSAGYRSRTVRAEVRENLEARLRAGERAIDGVLGYDETVLPQLENALLAEHDVILLGERGQAKTRLARGLVGLLDEWLPVVEGSPLRDDPFAPVSAPARELVAERGDDTPIAWVHRRDRYAEKLATPDTSMADLIGDIDPIRVASGLFLDDPRAIAYGLVARANRGIFAINELPDLAERIQVGLLNVLEERDVQIRAHLVRLELDLLVVATANPEDYTNRGRLITPLKDRFGSQIRTHYPRDVATEMAIVRAESRLPASPPVEVPWFIEEIVGRVSQLARQSTAVSQHSGVSVRVSIADFEAVAANAVRRSLHAGDALAVPRISDLAAVVQAATGKLELEGLDDQDPERVIATLVALAVRQCFTERVVLPDAGALVGSFEGEVVVHAGDDLPDAHYAEVLAALPALAAAADQVAGPGAGPGQRAAAAEFVLEGLHLTKRLAKEARGPRALYRARSGR